MTWIDLYSFLCKKANDMTNLGAFPWQDEIEVFDWETLEYYSADFIQMPADDKISFAIDTYQQPEIKE